ncbi:MAG: carboxymuconolactone decarboxylase family protein [Deltaproteobacteria bacterium]|nr:carboxymuconolactone decarboxylase family protein [Deltaproteobacteria bacterium]
MSDDKLAAVARYGDSDLFSAVEKDALALTDAMCETPVAVPDELYERLRAALTPQQLVELTATIAWENFRARFNRCHQIGADGFSTGAFCVLPVPARPPANGS